MKKVLSVLLVVVLALSLAACSSGTGEVKEPSSVTGGGVSETQPGDVSAEPEKPDGEPEGEGEAESEPEAQKETIGETVLVDEAGVLITAKSLDLDSTFGPALKLLIENNSGSDLTVQCRDASVNGYMVDTMMSVDVVNGKKANDSLTFLASDLENCGIQEIADMEFKFHIFTTEDWEGYLDTDVIQVKTSIADTYEYTYDDSGDVAYEGGGIKIVVKGLAEDSSIIGPGVVVYIENAAGEDITVQTRDVSINGYMVNAMFSCDVVQGKHAVDSITFMSSELEENEIEDIEDIELSFHIFNADTWNTIADSETVTITF